jgi:hypothetical protein
MANNRMAMNKKANAILKKKFMDMGITWCEYPKCGSTNFLSFAHKFKRRYMNTVEELSDINNVLLLCIPHHELIEHSRTATEELFNTLRGKVLKSKCEES